MYLRFGFFIQLFVEMKYIAFRKGIKEYLLFIILIADKSLGNRVRTNLWLPSPSFPGRFYETSLSRASCLMQEKLII